MAEIRDSSKVAQIKNLLAVFGTGIIAALALAGGILFYYNPSGSYVAGNVLLSPELAAVLQYSEGNPRSDRYNRFIFEGMHYTYFIAAQKKTETISIPLKGYQKLYNLIANERSLTNADNATKSLFTLEHSSSLILRMYPESSKESKEKFSLIFLQIDFVKDYYRIQLREQSAGEKWAYFYHPGILIQIHSIFK